MKTFLALAITLVSALPLRAANLLSTFSCSRPATEHDAGTLFNVGLACKIINGQVVPAGATFSFNHCLEKSGAHFEEGRSILDGHYVYTHGGGYCQVSTALYNAALLANLPVVERYPHSLYDPADAYVPAGEDASVSRYHGADFRFVNDTPHAITISTRQVGKEVVAEIWGRARTRKRWITTKILKVTPMRTLVRVSPALAPGRQELKREGFQGLRVQRFIHWIDDKGDTRSASLGIDRYNMISRILLEGPPAAVTSTASAMASGVSPTSGTGLGGR